MACLRNYAKILRMLMAELTLKLNYLECQSQRQHPTRVVALRAVVNIMAKFLEGTRNRGPAQQR